MFRYRGLTALTVLICFGAIYLICFGKAMNGAVQFGFRDAGHFYYPLYQRVQTEWEAGRWPLWEPEENAGMPLLGNPTAAVLYPGKLIYTFLPYPTAARVYIMAHAALAFVAMLLMMRSWSVSPAGSGLAALSYAFGAPVLFQYCNIIYLVGAAWLPLGFLAVDRWLSMGSRGALLGLALVLTMQVLGGDPQAAYLLGLCSGAYALGLTWWRSHGGDARSEHSDPPAARGWSRWWLIPAFLCVIGVWVWGAITLATVLPRYRPPGHPAPALPWMPYVPRVVLLGWGLLTVVLLRKWIARGRAWPPGVMLLGLVGAAVLSAVLSAAQVLPILEFTQQTVRAEGEGPHDIYPFSIEPIRLAELVWPNVTGTSYGRDANWLEAVQSVGVRQKVWVPSLYLGGVALMLSAAAFSLRGASARRVWLSAIVLASLVGSLGPYTSPIWGARMLARTAHVRVPDIGPLDTNDSTPIRLDRYLRDGDGGLYWMMTTFLPGFRQFRFPAKLFTFAALGIAALAGLAWDSLCSGRHRGLRWLAGALGLMSLGLLAAVLLNRQALLTAFSARHVTTSYGPLDVEAGFAELTWGLAQGAVVSLVAFVLLWMAPRRPRLAGTLMLALSTADLAVANSRYVSVIPQALLEGEPEVLKIIHDAERAKPASGPYRVYRMPLWNPPEWLMTGSDHRGREFVEWERATLQPKYGINEGVEHTHTIGVAEIYDFEWFFGGFPWKVWGQTARSLGVAPGNEVIYFPRRTFDIWGSRYFILPWLSNGWMDEARGYAAFLADTELIYPPLDQFEGAEKTEKLKAWSQTHDYQVRRNVTVYPRAWVVHEGRNLPSLEGRSRLERSGPMQDMLYSADEIWNNPNMPVHDPRRVAWIETADVIALHDHLRGQPPHAGETVTVRYPRPDTVEIEANLTVPGLVVLADTYYPGWTLTIDGKPAPIYRVNRMMRGAAAPAGRSRLVYRYTPRSFEVGRMVSLVGLGAFGLLAVFCLLPRRRRLARSD